MAPSEPHPEPPDSPRDQEPSPETTPLQRDEDEDSNNLDDMPLEEFLEDIYYNPFGPPPGDD